MNNPFDFLGNDFNPATEAAEAPSSDFAPIPDGEYLCEIRKCELKPTKDGTGTRLSVGVVLVGEHSGRWVWDSINVRNRSEAAQRIGRQQFGALCCACGYPSRPPSSPDDLVGKEVRVQVYSEEYAGKVQNRIKSYKASGPAAAVVAKRNPWDRQ